MTMQRSLRIFLMLLLAGALTQAAPALAQQTVSGTVTDAQNGETLPGATVSVVGAAAGTATGMDGSYELNVPSDADSLRYSFVGYDAQTVAIAGRSVIDVALSPSTQELDDLVVIGYGSVQERDVTGSVQAISTDDFNPASTVNPEQVIAGKIPGVQISSSSGAPGAQTFIRIRGATSINADTRPLFVIDGVPISNESSQAQRNPLNFLAPSDIKSVTVLKDASATAIYGSRGANGVILIETKDAQPGRAQVTYSGKASASVISGEISVLNADEFRNVVQEQAPEIVPRLGNTSTDWQDLVQRDAFGQEHSISFSRGYEDSDIRLGLNYLNQDGIINASSSERISASLKYNQTFFDGDLQIRSSLRGAQTKDVFEPLGAVGAAASFDPTQPVRDVRSEFGGFYEWDERLATDNPLGNIILESNRGETVRSLGNVEAEYALPYVDGLSARVNLGYDVATGEREFFAPTNLKGQSERDDPPGTVTRANFTRLNQLVDAYLNYKQEFDGIASRFDVTAGYSYQDFNEEYPEFELRGLNTDIFGPNAVALSSDGQTDPTIEEIPSRLISLFGRVNYTFRDKYLLTVTVRRDGSSRFGPRNQWGTFPSAALAWRAHQEGFLQDNDAISTLKFRASWGITGNQEIPDFQFLPFYEGGGQQAQQQFGDRFVPTIRPRSADINLKWEETTSVNLGVDYGLFGERLSGSIDVYRKDTDDLLFNVTAPGGANLSNFVLTNIGEMRNEGVEVGLSAAIVQQGDFTYTAQVNASTNRNEIRRIDREGEDIPVGGISGGTGNTIQVLREGEAVNSFLTFIHRRDSNGNPIFEDTNDDGVITQDDLYVDVNEDGTINSQDRVISGNPQPDWIVGHTSQFGYKNFDLSFTMRAHLDQQVYNNVASNFGHFSRLTNNGVPTNVHESVLDTGFETPQYFSDVYVEDASFLRMDDLTLGYTFDVIPNVERLRVYTSASNLFVLTGYSGPDPEVGGSPDLDATAVGIDDNTYPRSRTFTAGVNIQF